LALAVEETLALDQQLHMEEEMVDSLLAGVLEALEAEQQNMEDQEAHKQVVEQELLDKDIQDLRFLADHKVLHMLEGVLQVQQVAILQGEQFLIQHIP
jgi:SMC interacting uncharacterized protein involved in chromosome segregation